MPCQLARDTWMAFSNNVLTFFHRTQQGVLLLLRDTGNLRHLGLGNFVAENTANTLAFGMHLQHHAGRLVALHREHRLKNLHHEFHRRKIIVQQ